MQGVVWDYNIPVTIQKYVNSSCYKKQQDFQLEGISQDFHEEIR